MRDVGDCGVVLAVFLTMPTPLLPSQLLRSLYFSLAFSSLVLVQASFSSTPRQVRIGQVKVHQKVISDIDDGRWKRELNREFISIAVPAFFQQAAVPLADLVDATFLSRLEPGALGGIGIARSSHSAVSKLYNTPLSTSSVSLIASKCAAATNATATQQAKDELSVAVASALILGLSVGLLQMLAFSLAAGPILNAMGIGPSSAMAPTAISFMRAKAFSAPSTTLWLVATGAFRGLGDSWTPFLCAVFLNLINLWLDPIFIITSGLGAAGAAHVTTIAQTVALVPMLWILHRRVHVRFQYKIPKLTASLTLYFKAGMYLLGRTIARVAAFALCSRESARLGSLGASAYSVTFQIGFWITLGCESVTIATQALISREASQKSADHSRKMVEHLAGYAILTGVLVSGLASLGTWLFRHQIISALIKNLEVQSIVLGALPAFLATQIVKGFTFSVNGIIMGKMDWSFSFWSIWLANLACFLTLRLGPAPETVGRIWTAWTAFMATQAICGYFRFASQQEGNI